MSYFCTSVSYLLVLYAITLLASNISLHKRFQTFPKLSLNIPERLDVQLFSEALDNPRCSEMLRNSVKHDREKWMFKKMLVTIQTSTLKCTLLCWRHEYECATSIQDCYCVCVTKHELDNMSDKELSQEISILKTGFRMREKNQ